MMAPARLALGLAVLLTATTYAQSQRPTFRSGVAAVTADVSVKRGNLPVSGLSAGDFRLTDNGVEQSIESVSIEAVPLDVTLFHDTSGSLEGRLEDLKADVRRIAGLLRDEDRLRLLVLGDHQVVDVFGWRASGQPLDLDGVAVGWMSPVNDALITALLHRPDVGRRHLIVALTDAIEYGGTLSAQHVLDVAGRAEGVLHLVLMGTSVGSNGGRPIWVATGSEGRDAIDRLRDAASLTGGEAHDRFFGSPNPVDEFDRILNDFRASYVLRYTPTGVDRPGWHEIEVTVPSVPRATIRARRGYYGE